MDLVAVDSSVLIDHFRGRSKAFLDLLVLHDAKKIRLMLPAVVIFEIEKGKEMEKIESRERFYKTISFLERFGVNEEVAVLAGEAIRRGKILTDPVDAFIAATAVLAGAKLTTLNRRHFRSFPGLTLFEDKVSSNSTTKAW